MFVSRKNLPFIHLIPAEVTAGPDVTETLHQGVHFLAAPRPCRVLQQPFAERRIESLVLRASIEPCLLD